ncbi:MAG: cupredoxin domain-containing protein [Solirubrobacterales bacterium]
MHSKLSRRARLRALALAVPAAAFAIILGSSSLAGATGTVPDTGTTDQVKIELTHGKLKFVGPETVAYGDQLEIVNETNPKEVGPHTFALVTKGSIPKTAKARKNCFTPKHICLAIAKWHGFNPKTEKITMNPAKAGPEGWSTMGNATGKKGDSWFTGEKKGATFSQQVTAAPGTTLYFQCAVHPWMHGQVTVTPAPTA